MSNKSQVPYNDCYVHALPDEELFTLVARDICAPDTIEFWVRERLKKGLNQPDDKQISEALNCAAKMRADRDQVRAKLKEAGIVERK